MDFEIVREISQIETFATSGVGRKQFTIKYLL